MIFIVEYHKIHNMIKRTLYFGNPAYLNKKDMQLKVIDAETKTEKASIPLEDIAVVILDNYQITITHALISDFADRNVALISCDSRHMPSGLMLPLDGNHVQAERFRIQKEATAPLDIPAMLTPRSGDIDPSDFRFRNDRYVTKLHFSS